MSTDTQEAAPAAAPAESTLPLTGTLAAYDGPTSDEGVERHAVLLATARCSMHPLYRNSPGDCLTLLYRARALNIPLGVALDHVYINTNVGRSGLSAQLMAALLLRAGITWKTVRQTDQVVEFRFKRGRKIIGSAKWEIREAVAAGLTKRLHWQLWPVDCLWARAMARGCRRYFSDIVMGMGYTPEEIHDMGRSDAMPEESVTVDPAVQYFIDEADSESATAALIRSDIMVRARKAKLLRSVLPDGRTLEQHLSEMWRVKTDAETAERADAAMTNLAGNVDAADQVPAPDPAADLPAGTGQLVCGCSAEQLANTGTHGEGCRDRADITG